MAATSLVCDRTIFNIVQFAATRAANISFSRLASPRITYCVFGGTITNKVARLVRIVSP